MILPPRITGVEGKLGVSVGPAIVAFSRGAMTTLQESGARNAREPLVPLNLVVRPQNQIVEVHAEDAVFRPELRVLTQADVRMLEPKILKVSAVHGNLELVPRRISTAAVKEKRIESSWMRPPNRKSQRGPERRRLAPGKRRRSILLPMAQQVG